MKTEYVSLIIIYLNLYSLYKKKQVNDPFLISVEWFLTYFVYFQESRKREVFLKSLSTIKILNSVYDNFGLLIIVTHCREENF